MGKGKWGKDMGTRPVDVTGLPKGRHIGDKKITAKDQYKFVCDYIETGSYTMVAENNKQSRTTVTRYIKKFIRECPDEFNKMLDAFLMRNKQEMILNNTYTTVKALDKVNEMLDDPTACKNVKDVAMTYGILYDKGALMKGESTSNQALVIKMAGDIEELSK